MKEVKQKRKAAKVRPTQPLIEAPRRIVPVERDNAVPQLSEDIQRMLAARGIEHEQLRDIAVDIARIVHFTIPSGAMYDSSVKLAEFVSAMAYKPPGIDPKAINRLHKAVKDCGFDWGSLCNKADTVLSIASADRLKELDQLIYEGNNDLIALYAMQKKYARPGKVGITGGNFIQAKLTKLDNERETLLTRFPELADKDYQG